MKQLKHLDKLELAEAVKLADLVFREEGQSSMGTSFPAIFNPALGLSLGVLDDEKLVSFIGFVPQQIAVGHARINACALGSVCTHPHYRGQGHASVLLEEAFHQAEAIGASLMLISGTRSLYRRNGCYAFGSVRRYRLEPAQDRQRDMNVRPLTRTDWFQLQQLSHAKPAAYRRSVSELAEQLESEAVAGMYRFRHTTYVMEEGGRLTAYAVIASGDIPSGSDLEPFVVEWGGESAKALATAHAAMDDMELSSLLIFVSAHETAMQKQLRDRPYSSSHNQGTVRIMDLSLLWRQLEPYLQQQEAGKKREIQAVRRPDGDYSLRLAGEDIPLTLRQWTALLFDGPEAELDDGPDAFVRRSAPKAVDPESGGPRSASNRGGSAVALQAAADLQQSPGLPFNDMQIELLKTYFPLPFPYTAGLSYI